MTVPLCSQITASMNMQSNISGIQHIKETLQLIQLINIDESFKENFVYWTPQFILMAIAIYHVREQLPTDIIFQNRIYT